MLRLTVLLLILTSSVSYGQLSTRLSQAPSWVQYMYSENPNLITLRDMFDAYYASHDFVKNQDTQNFKRLMKNHWIEKSVDGYIQYNVEYPEPAVAKSPTSVWEEIGPWDYDHEQAMEFEVQSPGSAHIYTVEQSPVNPDLVLAGSATAGLWKSTDKGLNWALITKDMDIASVYSIALDPSNSDVMYFGEKTGQIWKSIDGGVNWNATGDASFQSSNYYVRDLKIIGSNTLLAATHIGLFRSTDGGLSWNNVHAGEHMEIEIKPDNPNVLYTVKLNGSKTEFYKSTDNGLTWVLKPIGWPAPTTGDEQKRCEISVTPADPNLIYILAAGTVGVDGGLYGIYKSIDAGETFSFECCDGAPGGTASVTNPNILGWSEDGSGEGGQFYYDLALGTSPTNSSKLFGAGINAWRSEDAGANWTINSHWVTWALGLKHRYSHADVHDIKFFQNGPDVDMWVASDGGLFYSSTQGDTLEPRMHGIHGTDFWGFGSGFKDGYVMVGGTYHNGTLIRYNDIYKGGLADPNVGGWLAELGGDNYRGFVNYGDNSIGYADNGAFNFSDTRTERISSKSFQGDKKCNTSYIAGEYGTYGFHPHLYNTFYSPVDTKLYKTTDGGVSFVELYDFGGDKVIQVKVSWADANTLFLTHKNGGNDFKIWRSNDGGFSWTDVTPTSAETGNNYYRPKYIELDEKDPNKLWCILMGTQTGNKVFESTDGGNTWQNITTPTIENENVVSIVHHYGTNDGLYIGTQRRVYYRNSGMADWALFNNGLPARTSTYFIEPYYGEGKIRSASQRGVHQCDFYEDGEPVANFASDRNYVNLASSCVSDTVQYVDHSTVRHATAQWQWYFEGGSPATSNLENPKVVYTNPGTYDVKLVVTDAFGVDSLEIIDFITIVENYSNPQIVENFNGTTFPPYGWKLYDSQGTSWQQDWPEGDDSDRVAGYPNYWVDATGEDHYLITPAVDLSNAVNYIMTFDYTYNDNNSYTDSLAVLYRTGSQPSWQTIWQRGGANLEVFGTEVWYWYNQNADITWNNQYVDLSFLSGESCVEFAFANLGTYGNHIWIDNVNLTGDFLGLSSQKEVFVNVFPNPSTSIFEIRASQPISQYTVTDIKGKVVIEKQMNQQKELTIDLGNEDAGIYFLSIQTVYGVTMKQLIKH